MNITNQNEASRKDRILGWIRGLARPHSSIQEVGLRRQASLLAALSFILLAGSILGVVSIVATATIETPNWGSVINLSGLIVVVFIVYILARSPFFRIGAILLVAFLSIMAYITIFFNLDPGEQVQDGLYLYILLAFVLGSVMISFKGLIALVVSNIVVTALLPAVSDQFPVSDVYTALGGIMNIGAFLVLTVGVRNAVERDRLAELRAANQELEAIRESLEDRVKQRTRALASSAEVSRRLSTILDQKQLLVSVVEEIQSAFGYYHAHFYLIDEAGESLLMAGGTGEAGQALLRSGHKVTMGKGLVGRAAATGQAILVADTSQDPNWLPNPLLPETKSEVAVPIMTGNRLLGVLDVQQNIVNSLGEDDLQLLQSVANQVAVAVQNAQVYAVSQQQAEREMAVNLMSRRIQSAQTIDDVLRVVVQELQQLSGARKASIQIGATPDSKPE